MAHFDPLGKLALNTIYKVIIYISGIVFILSIFLEVKILNTQTIMGKALGCLVVGVLLWFLENVFSSWGDWAEYKHKSDQDIGSVAVLYYILQAILLFIGILIIFA